MTPRSVLVVSLAVVIASIGRAEASEPGSFTDRVQKSLGIGTMSEERAATGTPDLSTYGEPTSFIARVQRSLNVGTQGEASLAAAPRSYGEPASFIARVQRSQSVGHPLTVEREDQLSPEQIRLVQRTLAEKGYATEVTGRLDEKTRSSLMSFQRSEDIPASGTVDARTVEALGFDPRQVTPVRGPAESR